MAYTQRRAGRLGHYRYLDPARYVDAASRGFAILICSSACLDFFIGSPYHFKQLNAIVVSIVSVDLPG